MEGPMHAVENGILLIVVVAAGTVAARRLRLEPPILLLAVGLTLFSTVVVGLVAHAVIPGLGLAAALALGAILAPPDAVSATAVARRTGLPRRIVTVLEGESLLNDATALVAYRVAVAAAVSGVFSPAELSWRFALASVGGAVVGLAVALAVDWLRRRIDDPIIDNTMSLVAPFAAYLPAEVIGASGVLAVVVTGLYLGYQATVTMTAASRLVSKSVWKVVEFLLQGTVFTLIGLQLREVLAGLRGYDPAVVVVAALALAAGGLVGGDARGGVAGRRLRAAADGALRRPLSPARPAAVPHLRDHWGDPGGAGRDHAGADPPAGDPRAGPHHRRAPGGLRPATGGQRRAGAPGGAAALRAGAAARGCRAAPAARGRPDAGSMGTARLTEHRRRGLPDAVRRLPAAAPRDAGRRARGAGSLARQRQAG